LTTRLLSLTFICAFTAIGGYVVRGRLTVVRRAISPLWVETVADAQYGPSPENRIRVERPRWNWRPDAPAVLVFHGGSWKYGTRDDMEDRVCRRYLDAGFVVGNVEYRRGVKAPAAVEDALRAAAWFAKAAPQYGADPGKLVVTGESAGAHLALMVGLLGPDSALGYGARVAAIVNFYGIADLALMLQNGPSADFVREWLPEGPERERMAERMSPIHRLKPGSPPILTIHGTGDDTVPFDQSRRLTDAVLQAGGTAVLVRLPGARHGFSTPEFASAYGAVLPFLRAHKILAN
jgi:acetyl esterase/lipase